MNQTVNYPLAGIEVQRYAPAWLSLPVPAVPPTHEMFELGQQSQQWKLSANQRFFTSLVELLDSMFKTRCDATITSHLLKHQLKWRSAAQILGTSDPAAVLLQTLVHIYRDARIQAAVSAAKNVETVIRSAHL